ncbi:DNA-binding transcriptional activator DecR [Acinetobacter schindleri]|uniref:Lrp/AsnC family transcriptional regulator n=1 Tax=Acinetobacter schindleri TaxID=108981 RepID=UPI0030B649D6
MDMVDKKIIAGLQSDGRISLTELGEQIGLSLSPCHRRVRALEDSGIIKGYSVDLDYSKIGLKFSAIVFVTLKNGDRESVLNFEKAVLEISQITQAQRLFGDPDYILQVMTQDLESFQKLYDEYLTAIPNVQRLTSTIVMKNLVHNRHVKLY